MTYVMGIKDGGRGGGGAGTSSEPLGQEPESRGIEKK